MADDNTKPAIPPWQKAAITTPGPEAEAATSGPEALTTLGPEASTSPSGPEALTSTSGPEPEALTPPGPEASTTGPERPEASTLTPEASTSTLTPEASASTLTPEASTSTHGPPHLEQVTRFLEDAGVKDAPMEQKRAFLQTKGVQQTTSSAPPIITYPEFLVHAHTPPPLITPARMLTTGYVAAALAALIYAASTQLVTPLTSSLTSARHDFAAHSQRNLDTLTARLSSLVSAPPDPHPPRSTPADDPDNPPSDDRTALFHRDIGTQTSTPPRSRRASTASATQPTLSAQTARLAALSAHLSALLAGSASVADANEKTKQRFGALRHDLDALLYGGAGGSAVWGAGDEGLGGKAAQPKDAVEELRREIRAVKGVLLSAKRFPATVGRVAA